jgi:hypothetical protein
MTDFISSLYALLNTSKTTFRFGVFLDIWSMHAGYGITKEKNIKYRPIKRQGKWSFNKIRNAIKHANPCLPIPVTARPMPANPCLPTRACQSMPAYPCLPYPYLPIHACLPVTALPVPANPCLPTRDCPTRACQSVPASRACQSMPAYP